MILSLFFCKMVKKKERKEFGDLLTDSWKEYKNNFKLFFRSYLWLYIIPLAIVTIISGMMLINLFNTIPQFQQSILTGVQITLEDMKSFPPEVIASFLQYTKVVLMLGFIAAFLNFILFLGILYIVSFKKGRMNAREAIKGGLNYFWKGLGLIILLLIFLIPLYVLLIVPGIIFSVFWIFSFYVLFIEKKGIWDSLKGSYHLVKGKWWRTFGYILLFTLVVFAISVVINMPLLVIETILIRPGIENFSLIFSVLSAFGFITKVITSIIVLPLGVIFYRNMYSQWKEEKGRK